MSSEKQKKTLPELLAMMDTYSPIIPDAVADHYFAKAGLTTNDQRTTRLLALVAQKFISDIATDALQYSKTRHQVLPKERNQGKNPYKDKRCVMTMDDLSSALADYGVNSKKPEYFL